MLPSTGLFKSIQCPNYDAQKACSRPYCHFKHAKKDEDQNEIPVYIPTPKTLPQLLTLDNSPVKKKPKLEYIPTQPEINDVRNNKSYTTKIKDVPVYIPSNKLEKNNEPSEIQNGKNLNLDNCSEELDMIADVIARFSEDEDEYQEVDEKEIYSKHQQDLSPKNIKIKNENGKVDLDNGEKNTNENLNNSKEKENKEKSDDKEKYNKLNSKTKLPDISKINEKDKSKHRHNSHSSSRDRQDKKHRDRHKSSSEKKIKEKKKIMAEDRSRSSESKHSSSSRSKSSSKELSSSKKRQNTSSSRHKSSTSHKSKESSSKPKLNSEFKKSNTEKSEILNKKVDLFELSLTESVVDSDEDDVMEQCKQIFEEFNNTQKKSDIKPETKEKKDVEKRKSLESVEEISQEDASKKKRVAHEGAFTTTNKIVEAPIVKKANHVQSAYQSVYARQEILRKSQKDKEAAAYAMVKEAEEKLREAEENLRKATMTQKQNLTPLIPKSYLTPPKISVKPIINYLALEKAKKKVEEMRKLKGPTLAQSLTKGTFRKAHNPSTSTTVSGSDNNTNEISNQPAPPVLEPNSTKISYNIRMQLYNQMVKYCLDIYPKCEDAWERAQTEELAVFKKCSTPIIYRSSSVLTINKLRKESIAAGNTCTTKNKTISHEVILAGKFASNVSVNKKINPANPFDRVSSEKVYELISDLCLSDEQLFQNGFPKRGSKRGTAIIHNVRPQTKATRENERICRRCAKTFNIAMYENEAIDECCYHRKGTGYRRGFTDNYHHCCQQPAGSPGCTYANYHVADNIDLNNLKGFVETMDKGKDYIPTKKDIYALDCEMCYTTEGIELTRVTVVNFDEKVVYDALVKPENKIIDYNTIYSGITEELLKNERRTIRDIQAILLSMFNSKTILIGHSLESDMKALKLIHSCIVDTSVLYPHKMGPPKKRALKNLCIENLKKIIQEDDGGHNSAEDAEVCIALVKHYLKIRIN